MSRPVTQPVRRIRLLVPANVRHKSGGNVYNSRLARELATLGAVVELLPVEGTWPRASEDERRRLAGVLGAAGAQPGDTNARGTNARADATTTVTGNAVTIVDGLIACGAPDELEDAAVAGHPVWILLHMPLAEHPRLEARALRAAAGVICTSSSASARITKRHDIHGVSVALPGTDPAALAAGSDPPHLVAVAALLPNKDQLLTIAALARLTDLPWTAALVGSDSADPGYAGLIRAAIGHHGLQDRVRITGQLTGNRLEEEWGAADLSLLVSKAETFGLVVTESIARGIPVVVRGGTGAVEALALAGAAGPTAEAGERAGENQAWPGAAVVLDTDPAPLAALLRRWLTEPDIRDGWRLAAVRGRERLPRWDATARRVLEIVAGGRPDATAAGPADRQ
ncbi:glycosyltransferase family 4 protein [Micrococcaceae bacterium Sec5.7]